MIKNYIKIAWRNILKNKIIFGVNIIGLAIGIASCIMIALFVIDELSYDRFNKNVDQIARVVLKANINGETMNEAVVMAPVAETFKKDLPEVIDATRIRNLYSPQITSGNRTFRDSKFAYVDPNFFSVFTLNIINGNTKNPLDKPNTIVITETQAIKYFGKDDPIGKTLKLVNNEREYVVTAVMEEVPRNSHFHFDMFASSLGYELAEETSWTSSNFYTYLLIKEDTNLKKLEQKIPKLLETYMGPQINSEIGVSYEEFIKDNEIGLFLQPLKDIYLKSNFISTTDLERGSDIKYIYIFGSVAIFMLLLACINFINLSTASASKRVKEVGVRKVLGSGKKQLIIQFLAEAIIATFIAMLIAFFLILIFLPLFNSISGKELNLTYLLNAKTGIILFCLSIFIGCIAGTYPAFFLSSFKPINILKNSFSFGKNKRTRSGLVVFQFIISAGLVLSTLVVFEQMKFMQEKDLGYDKEQLLVLRNSYLLDGNNNSILKEELLNDPMITNVTQSAYVPAGVSDVSMSGIFLGETYQRRMFTYDIDENYIPTMGMELISGRNFSKHFGDENNNTIINEEAAKLLGFGDNAIGKQFLRDTNNGKQKLTVVGVVKNFNFKSLHQKIDPLIMLNNVYGGLIVSVKGRNMTEVINKANTLWLGFNEKEDFSYTILDDSYNQQYVSEKKMGTILSVFSGLTIFVACLGLFGLITYTAQQRTKEIGIRKVLGSSVTQIIKLLSKDFIKLVFISFLIAFPIVYYLMSKWLQDFAYRISFSLWYVVLAAALTIVVALITIVSKSFFAAITNPVNSLRSE